MRLTTSALALACAAALAGCGGETQAGSPREIVLPVFVSSNTSDHFGAVLAGENERPVPVATKARGNSIFTLSEDGTSMHYKLIVANLNNATMAHIHVAPADSAGPIVVWLFGQGNPPTAPIPGGVTENGVIAEGDFTAANFRGPLLGRTMADLVTLMMNGRTYVNVHTVARPAGEIRGQIEEHGPSR